MGTVADYRMKRAPLSGRFWSERHQHGNPAAIEIVGTALSGETALSFAAPVGGNSLGSSAGMSRYASSPDSARSRTSQTREARG